MDLAEPTRPVIKVLLVAELSVLTAGKTPFKTSLFPPTEGVVSVGIIPKGHELNAVLSARDALVVLWLIPMFRKED